MKEPEISILDLRERIIVLRGKKFKVEMSIKPKGDSYFALVPEEEIHRAFRDVEGLLNFMSYLSDELDVIRDRLIRIARKEGLLKCQKK